MIRCDHLSDRMPDVARDHASWSGEEAAHLVRCDACRLEWDLIQRTARLGASVTAQLDAAAIADAVRHRLRAAPAGTARIADAEVEVEVEAEVETEGARPWAERWIARGVTALALAASFVLFLRAVSEPADRPGAARSDEARVAESSGPSRLALAVPELDDVPVEALDTVLRSLEPPVRADEWLESSWSDAENRAFERGFSMVSFREE